MEIVLVTILVPLLMSTVLFGGACVIAKIITKIMWNNSHK